MVECNFDLKSEPKVKIKTISKAVDKTTNENGLQHFNFRKSKKIGSANQCFEILTGTLTCFIVFLPVILSWGSSTLYQPQTPFVWSTANANESVAIKVWYIILAN